MLLHTVAFSPRFFFFPFHPISWCYLILHWESLPFPNLGSWLAFKLIIAFPTGFSRCTRREGGDPWYWKRWGTQCIYYQLPSHQLAGMLGKVWSLKGFLSVKAFLSAILGAIQLLPRFFIFFYFVLIGIFLNLQGGFHPINTSTPVWCATV